VAIRADETARIREFIRASMALSFLNSSPYHLREKPENSAMLSEELKENTIITIIGI
jgi:hypothetical protein